MTDSLWRKRKNLDDDIQNYKEPWEIWRDTKKNVYKSEQSTYGRSTDIHIGEAACEICGERTTIMEIDTSDGEYNLFNCCKPCFEKLWEKNT